jgi:hypothetical protein
MVSWSIARQHFLRIRDRRAAADVVPWIHQLPTGCEDPLLELKAPTVPLTHLASEESQSLHREVRREHTHISQASDDQDDERIRRD